MPGISFNPITVCQLILKDLAKPRLGLVTRESVSVQRRSAAALASRLADQAANHEGCCALLGRSPSLDGAAYENTTSAGGTRRSLGVMALGVVARVSSCC